jgi:protoporphyrinogen/coproporphyrinogen III oxidase
LADELVEYLLDPVMKGVYAGDVTRLSARTVLKRLFDLEQQHGSIIKGLWSTRNEKSRQDPQHPLFSDLNLNNYGTLLKEQSIYYLRDGMETLVSALVQALQKETHVQLLLNQSIDRLDFLSEPSGSVRLSMKNKETYRFDHLISAIPATELGALLDRQQHATLCLRLNQIECVPMIVVNLLYAKENIYPSEAFGYLIPTREESPLLGVLFDTCVRQEIDGQKQGSQLTVMMGGAWYNYWKLGRMNDEQVMQLVQTQLKKQMGLDAPPRHYRISRLDKAIPVDD